MSEIGKWLFPAPALTRSKLHYVEQFINVDRVYRFSERVSLSPEHLVFRNIAYISKSFQVSTSVCFVANGVFIY
jgi:hypothetical protein